MDKPAFTQEKLGEMMKNPEFAAKIREMADKVARNVSQVRDTQLVGLVVGHIFLDVETGRRYEYLGVMKRMDHSPLMQAVAAHGSRPFSQIEDHVYFAFGMQNAVIGNGNSAAFFMTTNDFLAYVACGKWTYESEPEVMEIPDGATFHLGTHEIKRKA